MPFKYLPLLLAGSLFLTACNSAPTQQTNNNPQAIPTQVANLNQDVEVGSNSSLSGSGAYTEYSPAALASAAAGETILFFHANWCPTCRAADKEITANLDKIPAGLTILKTDYDTEKELKAKYNIVSQHTFVVVDAKGNQITKWNGGGLQDIIENVNPV